MTLTARQVVWYVPWHGNPRNMTVSKVGRKWAATEERPDLKILIGTDEVHVPNFGRVGTIYLSREAREEQARLSAAWDDVRKDLYGKVTRPDAVTVEDINAARRLLGLEVLDG